VLGFNLVWFFAQTARVSSRFFWFFGCVMCLIWCLVGFF
jgi:hypothetical protein